MQLITTPIDKEVKEKLRKSKGKMVSEKVVTSPYGKVKTNIVEYFMNKLSYRLHIQQSVKYR
jgi:hypothetical protein